jgi:hypothetical protein
MQTAADRDFTMGLRLLLAAGRIEKLEDDYARERLAPLAVAYRMRAMQTFGAATPALHSS